MTRILPKAPGLRPTASDALEPTRPTPTAAPKQARPPLKAINWSTGSSAASSDANWLVRWRISLCHMFYLCLLRASRPRVAWSRAAKVNIKCAGSWCLVVGGDVHRRGGLVFFVMFLVVVVLAAFVVADQADVNRGEHHNTKAWTTPTISSMR